MCTAHLLEVKIVRKQAIERASAFHICFHSSIGPRVTGLRMSEPVFAFNLTLNTTANHSNEFNASECKGSIFRNEQVSILRSCRRPRASSFAVIIICHDVRTVRRIFECCSRSMSILLKSSKPRAHPQPIHEHILKPSKPHAHLLLADQLICLGSYLDYLTAACVPDKRCNITLTS